MMLPDYLMPTLKMLEQAYPKGIPEGDYLILLNILVRHMSQRSLTRVITAITGKDSGVVHNDVLGAVERSHDDIAEQRVLQALRMGGYDEWVATDS